MKRNLELGRKETAEIVSLVKITLLLSKPQSKNPFQWSSKILKQVSTKCSYLFIQAEHSKEVEKEEIRIKSLHEDMEMI